MAGTVKKDRQHNQNLGLEWERDKDRQTGAERENIFS